MEMEAENETVVEAAEARAADDLSEDTVPETAERPEEPDYGALAAEDLELLSAEFPELAGIDDLSLLDDPVRYGELRDLGLSPREAYLATAKFRTYKRSDTRSHLRDSIPRAAQGQAAGMKSNELSAARELFSGLPDAEIMRLYKRVTK